MNEPFKPAEIFLAALAEDATHMQAALALARRGQGQCWPNPSVGCVIVQAGRVVGRGFTAPAGGPHAEVTALRMAGPAARGATVYVTLEPCAHHGRTPPCAQALIEAGVVRVVVALGDPFPKVNGQGLQALRDAGIAVECGLLAKDAEHVTAGFLSRVQQGRPLVTLKLASTLDGRIATADGASRWITGEQTRRAVHRLRARHDAIMVGVGTAVADDPDLTCRLDGARHTPIVRIVADGFLRTPLTARLIATAQDTPSWFLHRAGAVAERREAFQSAGVRLFCVPGGVEEFDSAAALAMLGDAGLTSVLVEGGARLAASLLRADLVDRLVWCHAPTVMGGNGLPAVRDFGITELATMPRFSLLDRRSVGDDVMSEFERAD